jgi:hypothetical protein
VVESGRRQLIGEGCVLLRYLGEAKPSPRQLISYAKALEQSPPLRLPAFVRGCPALLRVIDPLDKETRLARRLQIASWLLDISAHRAPRLYDMAPRGRLATLLSFTVTAAIEAALLPVRLIGHRLWRA